MHKLGVIVPYRDRFEQLLIFKNTISYHLNKSGIDFELIVVEQDGAKTFNRGKLLNVGFQYAKKLKCDYVVFHDVDMLPIDVDYSYSPHPVHLASNFKSPIGFQRIVFDEYFGGVTIFPIDDFEKINGYSNEYWGWGYEDNDLLFRCQKYGLDLNQLKTKILGSNTSALKFNGINAYVKSKNTIDTDSNHTIFVSFSPEYIHCDVNKYDDTFSIFTIPGLDLSINYNSYSRYNFEIYDEDENIIYINSDIKPNYKTNICVTIDTDNKNIKMYQDGNLIGFKEYTVPLYNYKRQSKLYIGVGNPTRKENPKFFDGLINSVAIYSDVLNEDEVKEISNNKYFGLTHDFGKYESSDKLKLYYDAKFIKSYKLMDLSGNGNDGQIYNCEIVPYKMDEYKIVSIPYRRECMFELLEHAENGYVNGAWKDITTRYNQLRYYNEVSRGYINTKEDGLSNLKFKEHSNTSVNNQSHIIVGI